MLGASLRWNITNHESIESAIEEIIDSGFTNIEVCGLSLKQAKNFSRIMTRYNISINSIHNPCPDESSKDRKQLVPGDWLASLNEEQRKVAVDFAKKNY